MDFTDSPEDAAYRVRARAWLDANARRKPAGYLKRESGALSADELRLAQGLGRRGWHRVAAAHLRAGGGELRPVLLHPEQSWHVHPHRAAVLRRGHQRAPGAAGGAR